MSYKQRYARQFPAHMSIVEQRLVHTLIRAALYADLLIEVFDGEEVSLPPSDDEAAIQRETAATDMTVYRIYRRDDPKCLGGIVLIHGNEEDVVSDAFYNADTEVLIESICRAGYSSGGIGQ